jgi:tetratricopeptide (TPR) repeat protein
VCFVGKASFGPAGAAAAFALTAAIACDDGGFHAVTWDRALVGLAALALVVMVLNEVPRPGRPAIAIVCALAFLTAWTAASWLWSDSPPAALEEAQRVALYLAAAVVVVVAGRRLALGWLVGAVTAGVVPVAAWNLAVRLAPDWTGRAPVQRDIGSLAAPVGYANGLALLVVLGLLLAVGLASSTQVSPLRACAAALLVPFAADLALQQSDGGEVALAAGLVVLALVARRGFAAASLALLVLPLVGAAIVAHDHVVVLPPSQDVIAAAGSGHRLLLGLALLAAAQVGVAALLVPRLARSGGGAVPVRTAAAVAALLLVAGVAVAPFALRGHERGSYWAVAVREFRANPVLGSGAGTFSDWWVRTRTTTQSTQEAHSLYLETLAELGPIGLLALVIALGAPLAAAWRLRGTTWGPPLLAALVAYDVHAAVDFDWELAGVTLPAVLLGAAATVHVTPAGRAVALRSRLVAATALAALTGAAILALDGSSHLAAAQDAEAAGRFDTAIADAHGALRYAPWSADAWRVIGESKLAQGDRAGARAAFRSAVHLDPSAWQTWAELASVSTGEPRRAAEAEAARLNPLGGGR